MSVPDNYEIIEVVSSNATIRVDIDWEYQSIDELYVWQQDSATGDIFYFNLGDFAVVEKSDGSGDYIEVENVATAEAVVFTARNTAKTQTYELENSEPLDPVALIEALDKAIKLIQENYSQLGTPDKRAITSVNPFEYPDKQTRKLTYVSFDENGDLDLQTADEFTGGILGYAEEWANKPEDQLISEEAGGDGVDDYSALHHANKASASALSASTSESNASNSESNALASEDKANLWAEEDEDVEVETGKYSAKHYALKAEELSTSNKAVGNIMSPAFNMPLINSMSIITGIGNVTFERSTKATYVDQYGDVKYANPNEPRFEKKGLLVESAKTNYMYPSNDTTSPRWTDPLGDWSSISNTVTSPDGTNNADRITLNAVGSTLLRLSLDTISAGVHTVSFWAKVVSGGGVSQGDVDMNDEDSGVTTPDLSTMEVEWKRFSRTITTIGTATRADIELTAIGATDISIWGVQVEKSSYPTSYIETITQEESRSEETLTIDPRNRNNTAEGSSMIFDLQLVGLKGDNEIMEFGGGLPNLFQTYSPTAMVWWADGSATSFYGLSDITQTSQRFSFITNSSAEKSLYVDGTEIVGDNNSLVFDGKLPEIKIQGADAYYKNLRIYDKELTQQEVRLA